MCGIAGFAGADPRSYGADPYDVLRCMTGTIRHRGPDEDGHFAGDGVGLGMRRLSIIDLGGGQQPITNEDGSIVVVFNGEIYNYRELRDGLIRNGHTFRTCSDTETLVHLYEERGDALVDELRGMFAFAIWDTRRHRLLLARDRFGIKPLHYAVTKGTLVFGSEIRAIRAHPGVPERLDPAGIAEYLALGYTPEPRSVYEQIHKLPPAHLLVWQDGRAAVRRYWTLPDEPIAGIDEAEAATEIARLLEESVRYHLVSDVPVGAFLSGGVDSAAVVTEMVRQADGPVRTYSIGFREAAFNEAPAARVVAETLGTLHRERILEQDADALTTEILDAFDEPFADSSAIPTYVVARLARSELKVVLSGDGGDEVFGGYTRYFGAEASPAMLPGPARLALGALGRALPRGAYGRNRLIAYSRPPRGRYAMAVTDPLRVDEGGVARAEVASLVDIDHVLDRWFAEVPARGHLTQVTLVDLLSYLPGDILTKVDRMTMAVSLEARVPLLDHPLVEFAARLPSAYKFRDGSGKWIFRKALRGRVPDSVFTQPKRGFAVPLRHWLKDRISYRVDRLLEPGAAIAEYVDARALRSMIREFRVGRRDNSSAIWKLIVLDHWLAQRA